MDVTQPRPCPGLPPTSPSSVLQLDQGAAGPSGDVKGQEEMGVGEAPAFHSQLPTAIRCERREWGAGWWWELRCGG